MSLFLLPLVTQAHDADSHQPPIIAEYDDVWYAVSPDDGSATVLLEPDAGKKLVHLVRNFISPDHQWLAYIQYVPMMTSEDAYPYEPYLLNLETGEKRHIRPSGGIFDRPLPPNDVTRISLPT